MAKRLDSILAQCAGISRTQAQKAVRNGEIMLNGTAVTDPKTQADYGSEILYRGEKINTSETVLIMLNKPAGVISASRDMNEKTVIDLIPQRLYRKGLFPAGRLDRDTTGLMLITDNGQLAHSILSPRKHLPKQYEAVLDTSCSAELRKEFETGMVLDSGEKCLPAHLEISKLDPHKVTVVICEGMYHQIKRMFGKFHIGVVSLKRVRIGGLWLDETLAEGECRPLEDSEKEILFTP